MDEIRAKLREILTVLGGEETGYGGHLIKAALDGSDDELRQFLASNDLWGGPGSIADQALVDCKEKRSQFYKLMADLGELQIKLGILNVRTKGWTSAFREWERKGW